MRRTTLVILALATAFSLSACDSSATSTPPATAAGAQANQPQISTGVEFSTLNSLKGFPVGKQISTMARPTAFVLFDPQCPHCAHLWEAAKPLAAAVQIKWIPVGLLNGLSTTQSAMLLESKDPVAMMNANEAVYNSTGRPALTTVEVKDDSRKSVAENTAMLRTLKAISVPTIVYRDPLTKNLAIVSGALPTAKLAELLRVSPDQLLAAPAGQK